jgi:hypothetical protein
MKPTRKLNRGSFINQVAGAANKVTGGGGKAAPENDHDLAPSKGGAKPTDQDS